MIRSLFQEQGEATDGPMEKSTGENLLRSILFGCGGEEELGSRLQCMLGDQSGEHGSGLEQK